MSTRPSVETRVLLSVYFCNPSLSISVITYFRQDLKDKVLSYFKKTNEVKSSIKTMNVVLGTIAVNLTNRASGRGREFSKGSRLGNFVNTEG